MGFYRRRPTPPIEARQFHGDADTDLAAWAPRGKLELVAPGRFELKFVGCAELLMTAVKGDWIVRDGEGQFRAVKDAAFQETYEEAHPRRAGSRA